MIYETNTFCNPGSYVEVVPVGLRAQLQYNASGLLEKIAVLDSGEVVTPEVFRQLSNIVPTSISLKGGTTWVEGVFYSDNIPVASGRLPECTYSEFLSLKCTNLAFYAGRVDSKVANFAGALANRNWLSMARFRLLPGIVVPVNITEDTFNMMSVGGYSFEFPFISGFMIFEGTNYRYVSAQLSQKVIKAISTEFDENGYLYAVIETNLDTMKVPYSSYLKYNLGKGCSILCDTTATPETIIHSRYVDGRVHEAVSRVIKCPICMKNYSGYTQGHTCCDDVHCMSRQFLYTTKMIRLLKLEPVTFNEYLDLVKSHQLQCPTDVLLLEKNSNIQTTVSLSTLLNAAVPSEVCADKNIFDYIASCCNQSVETLAYYLANPLRMQTDMDIHSIQYSRLLDWLSDGYNLTTIHTLLISDKINIVEDAPKQEYAPIFRGRVFGITGKFKLGPVDKIADIIKQCAGTIADDLTAVEHVDMIVVGGLNEGVEGKYLHYAKQNKVPVMNEDDFLSHIDSMIGNLL